MSENPESSGFDEVANPEATEMESNNPQDSADPATDAGSPNTGPQDADPSDGARNESSSDDAATLQQRLQEAEAQVLRTHAELDNYRKRTQRSMEEDRKYAAMPLLKDLLPVLDNLSRAITAAGGENSDEGILQGVKMVVTQLESVLAQHGCEAIDAMGKPFDPNLHEAVGQQPHDEIPANHISLQLQTGYRLHDRVVRAAQVYVSTGPAANQDN